MTTLDDQARSVFLAALERAPEQWPALVNEACGSNTKLRARVDQLLHAHQASGSIHGGPAAIATTDEPITKRPGAVIGPYKLMEQIGEGGMGLVYVAEQQKPVNRRVALKIIKPGMDSRQVIARFEAERQALAMMEHPNIAKVFDGGTTSEPGCVSAGRPYFVMELVRGSPITEYCDTHCLTPRQRLELFLDVCHAVQHAHQKAIIHRDLKPSNVLVEVHDVQPVVKVIDFGIAKAIGQPLTDKTVYTALVQMVGTPMYMSPEQAGLSSLDVDTRSDVYSLGVLLYELLTGTTPFDQETLKTASYDEMRRIIREDEPPRPSTRISTIEQARLSTIAEQRKAEPHLLSRQLRGELDWIVMKALEKDRSRRYESASAFAADVQRYLDDEPVQACPPSAAYRFRKFARRHKGPVLAATAILLTLVAGLAGTAYGLIRAKEAWKAEAERANSESEAKEAALAREAETEAVLEFVQNRVFAAARPKDYPGGLGYDVKLADAIKAALPFVDKSFTGSPVIEARLRLTMGHSFLDLGDPKTAIGQYEMARRIYAKCCGPEDPRTLASMSNLASSYREAGRVQQALDLGEETLRLQKAKLGSEHPSTIITMNNLAITYAQTGRNRQALDLHQETLQLRKAKLGPDHPDTLQSMNNLASSYDDAGRIPEALKLREETLPLMKTQFGPDHADTLKTMGNLANSYRATGGIHEAIKLHKEILAVMNVKFGPDNPNTLKSMMNLAMSYEVDERTEAALKLYEETLQLMKAKLGPDHPDTLYCINNLAWLLATAPDVKARNAARAVELATEMVKASPKTADFHGTLGTALYQAGDRKSSITELEQAVRMRGPDNPMNANEGFFLAMAYWQLGDKDKAREWFTKSVAWMDKGLKDNADLKRFRAEAAAMLGERTGGK